MICRQGSTLLLVLSVIFIISIALLKCWKISSMCVDIQDQREKYYNRFYLIDGILKQTINIAAKNFDQILKSEQPVKIDFSGEAKIQGYAISGQIQRIVRKKKVKPDELAVSAFLMNDSDVVYSLKCLLCRKRIEGRLEPKFIVLGFTIL